MFFLQKLFVFIYDKLFSRRNKLILNSNFFWHFNAVAYLRKGWLRLPKTHVMFLTFDPMKLQTYKKTYLVDQLRNLQLSPIHIETWRHDYSDLKKGMGF